MKKFKIKKIGIIDGMGAFAGARFFQRLLEKISQENIPFPEIVLNAISIEDFIADPSKAIPAKKIISKRIKFFNQQKVSMIVMACNTAHIMHTDLLKIARCPFPSIIDLVISEIENQVTRRIGVLASPTTLKRKLYENKLNEVDLTPIIPDKRFQKLLEKIIRGVIDNRLSKLDVKNLNSSTKNFIRKNQLDGIILGCTELPLAFQKLKFNNIKIFDSLDILADAVVDHLKC
jgi:aspartate racemase